MKTDVAQRGGKLLGYGRYGCAFDKPLVCQKKRIITKKSEKGALMVGKLTSEDGAAHEIGATERLAPVKGAEEYFVLLTETCTPSPRSKQTEPDLKDCPVLETVPITQMKQVIMPFGGKALADITIRATSLDFFRFVQHILEAGTLLLMNKVVHFDLHGYNVLMSSRWKGKLIDFGMAWSPDALSLANLRDLQRTFNPGIHQEPPEVTYVNGRQSQMTSDLAIQKTLAEKVPLKNYSLLFNMNRELIDNAFRLFLRTSWVMRNEHWYAFYKLYWTKMDAWAIGVLILELYIDLLGDQDFIQSPEFAANHSKIELVIRHLCWVDPSERYDCAEALALYAPQSPLLEQIDVTEWLQTQRALRVELETALREGAGAKADENPRT